MINISQYNRLFEVTFIENRYYNASTGDTRTASGLGHGNCIGTDKFPISGKRHWLTTFDGRDAYNPNSYYVYYVHCWNGNTYLGGIRMPDNTEFPWITLPDGTDTIALRIGSTTDFPNNIAPDKMLLI